MSTLITTNSWAQNLAKTLTHQLVCVQLCTAYRVQQKNGDHAAQKIAAIAASRKLTTSGSAASAIEFGTQAGMKFKKLCDFFESRK